MSHEQTLHALIDGVHALGQGPHDLHAAALMLDYHEYGLAFELVLQQLHAHRTCLRAEQLALIQSAAAHLHVPAAHYQFVHQLLR